MAHRPTIMGTRHMVSACHYLASEAGFNYSAGYTAFQFVFVLLQASAFGGVFTGFGIAADFESGFARRLLLAAPNRPAILLGYALSGAARFLFTTVWITENA